VAGITGFSAERGDQLIVESLPFESTLNQEPPPPPPSAANPAPAFPRKLIVPIIAAGAGLCLACGLVLVWLMKRRRKAAVQMRLALEAEEQKQLADVVALEAPETMAELGEAMAEVPELVQASPPKLKRLTDLIAETITKDATGSCNVIRAWLNEE
jgi:flagellar M-ring protein FliF